MSCQSIVINRFGGPDVLELVEQAEPPEPGPGEVRIKVLAAGTGFTDTFIRRGRYPGANKKPFPITLGYDAVGTVDRLGPGVTSLQVGQMVADLCITGGYAQYAVRPANVLVPVPDGIDPGVAVCVPLAYMTAWQMLTRCCRLAEGDTILVVGASGTVGTALLELAAHLKLKAIGTASAAHLPVIARHGATPIDYREGDFVVAVRALTASRGAAGVNAAFDAIGGAHFRRSFACLAPGGMLVGYGSQTMAIGGEGLPAAALGLARLKLWQAAPFLFGGRTARWYAITDHRAAHPDAFAADMAELFAMIQAGAIRPEVIDRLPLSAARDVHTRIDRGGLGGKIVLLPWGAT